MQCLPYLLNCVLKAGLESLHIFIMKAWRFLAFNPCSVKRRDMYSAVCVELNRNFEPSSYDCETRWASAFHEVHSYIKAKRILNAVIVCISDVASIEISESNWAHCDNFGKFLKRSVDVTKYQSGQKYVTLHMSLRLFERREQNLNDSVVSNDGRLFDVDKTLHKL